LPENRVTTDDKSGVAEGVVFDTLAGVVVGAHGVQGTVKLKPVTSTSAKMFLPVGGKAGRMQIWLGPDANIGKVYDIITAKRQEPKDVYLVRLSGVDDRTSAEKLVGQFVFGSSADRLPLSEDEFFVDLIGLQIVDCHDESLGHLTVVHSGVANDVYETDKGVMIPAVKAFIRKIDLEHRTITVVDAAALVIE